MGDFLLNGFDIRIPHIHNDGHQGFSLGFGQTIEKSAQGPGFAMFADPDDTPAQIVQDNGQVLVPLADRNLVDGQKPQSLAPGLAILLFQKDFVDVLYGLPVQT